MNFNFINNKIINENDIKVITGIKFIKKINY